MTLHRKGRRGYAEDAGLVHPLRTLRILGALCVKAFYLYDPGTALAKADRRLAILSAMRAEDHFVAILDKGASLARGQCDRAGAVGAQLHQAAIALRGRTRDRASAEQIPGGEVAAVAGVMRDHLRHGPIEIG